MYPLSFSEFMSVYEGDKYEGLSEYMMYGGIPLVVLRKDLNEKAEALEFNISENSPVCNVPLEKLNLKNIII